jgi:methylglutaconyl-CoA hydratase
MTEPLAVTIEDRVARVTLTNPERHNALGPELIAGLTEAFQRLGIDPSVRAVVLAAEGKSFCAGADLEAMRRAAVTGKEENRAEARRLADLFRTIYECPKPVVGRVQGAAFGGGVGLVAVCDMVAALESATFCFSEVKLGLIPSVISPFVLQKVSPGVLRRYFLTAERIPAVDARRIGLVSETAPDEAELDRLVNDWLALLQKNGPEAMAACKRLLDEVAPVDWGAISELTAERIARQRASAEGREGISAFLEKRAPRWAEDGDVP